MKKLIQPNDFPHIIAAAKKTEEFGNIHRYVLFMPKGHLCSLHTPRLCGLIHYCYLSLGYIGNCHLRSWWSQCPPLGICKFVIQPSSKILLDYVEHIWVRLTHQKDWIWKLAKQSVSIVHLPHTQHTLGGTIWRFHASPSANAHANADSLAPDGANV